LGKVIGWLRRGAIDVGKVRQKEVLAVVGVSKPTIGEWERKGCPRNKDGSYNLAAVVQWREKQLEGRIAAGRSEQNRGRGRREMAQAELAELDLAQKKAELLPRGPTIAGWIGRYMAIRTMLTGLVRRCQGQYGLTKRQGNAIAGEVAAMIEELRRSQPALQLSERVVKAMKADARAAGRKRK